MANAAADQQDQGSAMDRKWTLPDQSNLLSYSGLIMSPFAGPELLGRGSFPCCINDLAVGETFAAALKGDASVTLAGPLPLGENPDRLTKLVKFVTPHLNP